MVVTDGDGVGRMFLLKLLPCATGPGELAVEVAEQEWGEVDRETGGWLLTELARHKVWAGGVWPVCECGEPACVHLGAVTALLKAGVLPAGGGR
jgi:hypothetical protein